MAETYPIRTIKPDEFTALCQVSAEAFLETLPPELIEYEREVVEFDRTIAAFDGDQIVGTAGAYSFELVVPGGRSPAAGVSLVSVRPTYRRRGILTSLMDRLLADAAGRGEALAILFASEPSIYGRFGYGLATLHQSLLFKRGEGKPSAGTATAEREAPRLRAAVPLAAKAELATVFDAVLPYQPGMVARNDCWWNHLLADPTAIKPPGMSALHCVIAEDDQGPRGYALYRTKASWGDDHLASGTVIVRELFSADPAATAALWTDLLTRDLAGEVTARMRSMDDPVVAMLANLRQARPSPSDGLWLRLIDVPAALRMRRYAAAADVVLEVADPVLPANSGRWRLLTAGPDADGTATCARTDDRADLRLPVHALGACYLGRSSLGQLAAAGQVAELTPGALGRLAAAMSWDRAPHSPMMF